MRDTDFPDKQIELVDAGLSLRRMGKEIAISFNTLNAYERDTIHPTLENFYKLSRQFDVPMEYFIFGDKLTGEVRDAELRTLLLEVDALKASDRKVIASYVRKLLNTKKRMEEFIYQAEEDIQEVRVYKKSIKKSEKS